MKRNWRVAKFWQAIPNIRTIAAGDCAPPDPALIEVQRRQNPPKGSPDLSDLEKTYFLFVLHIEG